VLFCACFHLPRDLLRFGVFCWEEIKRDNHRDTEDTEKNRKREKIILIQETFIIFSSSAFSPQKESLCELCVSVVNFRELG